MMVPSSSLLLLPFIEAIFCDRYFGKHLTHRNIPLGPYNNSLRWVLLSLGIVSSEKTEAQRG